MENQITLNEWMEWKEDIRKKLAEAAGNFVYIGYRLKQIRDSGMYDGCSDIFEFAQKEYGLGKSTVSRFIAINEKFSEGGNSLELREEYRDIGSSKLAEMLTLSDSECQLITERTTVKEIRELKQFVRQQVTEDVEEAVQYTPLQKCIIAFLGQQDKKKALDQTMELIMDMPSEENIKLAAELINPGEYATFKKGIIFLFLYDYTGGVKYKSMMESDPVSMLWSEFLLEITKIYGEYYEPGEKTWVNFYGDSATINESEKEPQKVVEKEMEKSQKTQENKAVATSQRKHQKEKKTEVEEEKNVQNPDQSVGKQEEAGSKQDNGEKEGELEELIESIQKQVIKIEDIYSWDVEELPTKEEMRKVRENLKMMLQQIDHLEEKLQEDKRK